MIAVASFVSGGDDRVAVVPRRNFHVLVVADGAGGTGSGAAAATQLVELVRQATEHAATFDAAALLAGADAAIHAAGHGGETTAVVAIVGPDGVTGASVGDSEAWIIDPDGVHRLTEHQQRKPLLGSGAAAVVPFASGPLAGTLVIGSDGLFKYTSAARIIAAARSSALDALPAALADLVRLRSGDLHDDVAVVVATAA